MKHRKIIKILTLFLFLSTLCLGNIFSEAESIFQQEKIEYDIKNFGLDSGDATLEFKTGQVIDGKTLDLIIFRAMAINFLDEEKIYVDPIKLFPVRVERNLNIFGLKEKITEYYDSKKGTVRVVKTAGGKTTEQTIQKQGKLDNIYCFIYRYRLAGDFQIGDTFKIHLPTKDIEMELKKKNKLKAAGQKFDSYFMQSNPKKYRVWFDAGENKIPLRIDGSVGFGNTYMVMKRYSRGDLQIGK